MPSYRRRFVPGGTYFFTVVTQDRTPIFRAPGAWPLLRPVLVECRRRWPFRTEAFALLPDHIHAIWSLPPGDDHYPLRWAFIQKEFTKRWIAEGGAEASVSSSRHRRGGRGVWQPRFWEHTIADGRDLERHADYIHYNPVTHGLARCPGDWPVTTFHRWVRTGSYEPDWGCADRSPSPGFADLDDTAME